MQPTKAFEYSKTHKEDQGKPKEKHVDAAITFGPGYGVEEQEYVHNDGGGGEEKINKEQKAMEEWMDK